MIRDKDKIYGEPNDPNTVLASGSLPDGKLIVGAGNKGIKTYTFTNNKSIIYIVNNQITELPISIPNKVLGTDEDGNLVWKDL